MIQFSITPLFVSNPAESFRINTPGPTLKKNVMQQITFRLKRGQDLRKGIEKVVRDKNIEAGVLLSVVGSLEGAKLRMAGSEPENQIVKEWSEPLEIVSGTGTISKNGCHVHVSLSDKEGSVIGGHLKDGCIVKSTAEVVLLVFEDISYKRVADEETGFKELGTE